MVTFIGRDPLPSVLRPLIAETNPHSVVAPLRQTRQCLRHESIDVCRVDHGERSAVLQVEMTSSAGNSINPTPYTQPMLSSAFVCTTACI